MKIYDISQEIFGCKVYPGDRGPSKITDMSMSNGSLYNLTSFEMGAHNGTHVDAPFHFFNDGDTIENIPLEKTVGYCYVTVQNESITEEKACEILACAQRKTGECSKRILIKGNGEMTVGGARIFADAGIYLIGVEGQSVGEESAPMEVHKILLDKKTVLLEGIRLTDIEPDVYLLNCTPIKLNGFDGAPCRAILIKE